MNICLICNGYPPENGGGIGTYTSTLANSLYEAGHAVTVITTSRLAGKLDSDQDSVNVIRVKVKYIPFLEKLMPGISWSFQLSLLLRKLQKQNLFDVIEFPNWEAPGVIYQLISRKSCVVVRVHTPYFETMQLDKGGASSFADKMVCKLEKLSCLKAHAIVSSTTAHANTISKEYGLTNKDFTILPLGVKDCFDHTLKTEKYVADGKFRILYISRLENRKGTRLLVDALPYLLENRPDIYIDIIGQDRPHAPNGLYFKEYFENNFKQYSEQVKFHGQLETEVCHDYLYKADLFVVPSIYESFGLIYPEAMMFELPCIATKGGGIPEVISNQETGLLIPENTPTSLAEAILSVYRSRETLATMSVEARRQFLQKFTDKKMALNTVANYQNVLSAQR